MSNIPKTKPFAPLAKTDGVTAIGATVIKIDSTFNEGINSFVDASESEPGEAVLALDGFSSEDPSTYMSVTFTERDTANNELKGVAQTGGTDQEWPAGTEIQANPTAYLLDLLKGNIETVEGRVLPAGGSSGQILKKSSATDYDTAWGAEQDISGKLDKSGDTMSGDLNMADNVVSRPKIKDYGETAVIATDVNGAVTIDLEDGNVIRHTLSDDVTYTFSNPPASGTAGSFTLIVEQPAAAKVITWPASVKWPNDVAPDDPGDSKVAIYTFITTDGGTRWYGMQAGNEMVV